MTKTSSHDPIDLYGQLDPTVGPGSATPDNEATVGLFEKISTENPREQHPAVAPKANRPRLTPNRFRLKRPILVAVPALALLVAAVVAVSVIAPIGTPSAVAEVKAAASRTAAFDRGRISSVIEAYAGDERVGVSSVDYRFVGDDFEYLNRLDADFIEHVQGVDLSELIEEQFGDVGPIDPDDIKVEPETTVRKVDGQSYYHDGTSWTRGIVEGTDLGDVESRSLAATHATEQLASCEGPAGFDTYCGSSDDREVIAALLLTQPESLLPDIEASIQIEIDQSTGLVHTVRATLTSRLEAEVLGITHSEAIITLSDLGSAEPIEAPDLPAPLSGPVNFEVEVPGVEGTCRGSGSIEEARNAIADCLVAKGVEVSTAELIAASLD